MILDILEEHLEEADMLAARRAGAWRSELLDLRGLEELEQRLDAHVEGLALGAEALLPSLESALVSEEPSLAFAAAAALVRAEPTGLAGRVLLSVADAPSTAAAGICAALRYVDSRDDIRATLAGWAVAGSPAQKALALDVLAFHEALPSTNWEEHARSPNAAVRRAAALAIRREAVPLHASSLGILLGDEDTSVRDAALRSAAGRGERGALERLREICSGDAVTADAIDLLACIGDGSDVRVMVNLAAREGLEEAALGALGTLAIPDAASELVRLMSVPALAPGAGAAFTRITGIEVPAAPDPATEGEDEGFEDLRDVPDPVAAAELWAKHVAAFQPTTRYRRGDRLDAATWRSDPHAGDLKTRFEEITRARFGEPAFLRRLELEAPATRQRRSAREKS